MGEDEAIVTKVLDGARLTKREHAAAACILRDWSQLARRGALDDTRRARLDEAVGLVQPHSPSELDRLSVSYHPAAGFPMVRVVEASALRRSFRARCAHATPGVPDRVVVYVDPAELHFRNYDHILPLDDVLSRSPMDAVVSSGFVEVTPGVWVATFERGGALEGALGELDALGLYVSPLHAGERGGGRFIFHSKVLASALDAALDAHAPAAIRENLSHVNPVFRMNRFAPGDEGFSPHHDSPYRDAARAQHSRYTLLLYLSSGEGAPALGFPDHDLREIAPMTCVIFEQRLKHHANPYVDHDKVFIRTELVHDDDGAVVENLALASAFSRACYLTHESLVFPELEAYMGECYARAARVHWEGERALSGGETARPMILKCFREVPFVTDGHDVWFLSEDMGLEEAAAIAVLDFFDVEIDARRFKTTCDAEVVQAPTGAARADFIEEVLSARARPTRRPFEAPPLDALLPRGEVRDPGICCPSPGCDYNVGDPEDFDATRNHDVLELYRRACRHVRARLSRAPVIMMGQEVWLNPERFVVTENQIHLLSEDRLEPVHFAAMDWCWRGHEPGEYIATEVSVDALSPILPPVVWRREAGLLHLRCDFFQNPWELTEPEPACELAEVYLPRVVSKDDSEEDQNWFEATRLEPGEV